MNSMPLKQVLNFLDLKHIKVSRKFQIQTAESMCLFHSEIHIFLSLGSTDMDVK